MDKIIYVLCRCFSQRLILFKQNLQYYNVFIISLQARMNGLGIQLETALLWSNARIKGLQKGLERSQFIVPVKWSPVFFEVFRKVNVASIKKWKQGPADYATAFSGRSRGCQNPDRSEVESNAVTTSNSEGRCENIIHTCLYSVFGIG